MDQSKTDEVFMPKLFLVFQHNLALVPGDSGDMPAVRDFGCLEEAQGFAKSEQSKWDYISIYSRCSEPIKTPNGDRYFKIIERYKRDGSVYIRCPECSFEYSAGEPDILETHLAGHHRQ